MAFPDRIAGSKTRFRSKRLCLVIEHRENLLPVHAREPLDEFVDRGAGGEVFEERVHRDSGSGEGPGAADSAGIEFHRGACRCVLPGKMSEMRGAGSAEGAGEMARVDADGLPVAGHGRLVPAPLELGAVERILAKVEQGLAEGAASAWGERLEAGSPGALQVGIRTVDRGSGPGLLMGKPPA